MDNNSWLRLQTQDPAFLLPPDLAQRDPFQARDCGWIEQMLPFIQHFCAPGQLLLDPFCGFGSTLVAAHLAGRRGIGVEVEQARAEIAAERLSRLGACDQKVLTGNVTGLAASLPEVQLILTNLPYFGCRWPGDKAAESQFYNASTYSAFLENIRQTFMALKLVLSQGGFLIVMVQNLQLGKHFVPLAWDTARLLSERYELLDERILVYERPRQPLAPHSVGSNRAHEYVLVARKHPKPIDLEETVACLKALAADFPDFVVYGSFANWLRDRTTSRLPSDADLLVPYDPARLTALTGWFEQHGFRLTRWSAPLHSALASVAMDRAHYFRAERLRSDGSLCLIDLCFEDDRYCFEDAQGQAQWIDGLAVLCGDI